MTTQIFTLPDLGEGLAEAELVRWLVAVGETIAVDQPIAEVETAKSVVEVPSPFAGVVETLHGEEGESLTVGAPLMSVAEPQDVEMSVAEPERDTRDDDFETAAGGLLNQRPEGSGNVLVGYGTTETTHTMRHRRRRVTSATPAGRVASASSAGRVASASERIETPDTPAGRVASASERIETPDTPDAGADTGLDKLVPRYSTTVSQPAHPIAVSSPVVRQLARARGVDLASVHATGADGVITRRDVEAALSERAPADVVADAASDVDPRTGLTVRSTTPLSLFRRTVAANMARSRSEIPEATVWVDVDATELRELRRRIRIEEKHPSIVALVARFTLTALARYPMLAARLSPDATSLVEFDDINLGVATDTPRGLVVPVIRGAVSMSLRELNAELERVTSAARYGTASTAELTGSTFTINNYGTLGVDGSAAIINHPEVAILGIGRMLERPWVVDGQIVPRTIMQLSLVFDHRVCDGGTAAGFLRMIADAIEHPYDAFADL
jgi:2-oxoisovalerate dehydrogenase E2 component (dihydrolipoyl transacylase)